MNIFSTLNPVDIGAIVLLIAGIIIGFRHGLSGEIARFIGTLAALVLGLYFYKSGGNVITENTRMGEAAANVTAFILIIAIILLLTLLARLILRSIMKISFEGGLEKAGGCIAGLLRAAMVVLMIIITMNMWPHDYLNRVFGKDSVIGRVVIKYMPAVKKQVENLPVEEKVEDIKEKISEEIK